MAMNMMINGDKTGHAHISSYAHDAISDMN
jgi:hypothetical protein